MPTCDDCGADLVVGFELVTFYDYRTIPVGICRLIYKVQVLLGVDPSAFDGPSFGRSIMKPSKGSNRGKTPKPEEVR